MSRSTDPTVYFVHHALEKWVDVLEADYPPSVDTMADRLVSGQDTWIMGTYITLKRRGLPVSVAPRFVRGAMCVAHYDDITPRSLSFQSYVVAVRADRDPVFLCDAEILQNPVALQRPTEHYVPFWVQPGLIPRDSSRQGRVERLAYFGRRRNLAYRFRSGSFEAELAALDISFCICESADGWRDYREVDAVLAVRDGTPEFFAGKPASKLINAWHAGCPALVGPESSYRAIRESDLDFMEVDSPDDAIRALATLHADPELYARMVRHGRERARDFSREAVADRWEALLFDTLASDFEHWSQLSWPRRLAKFGFRLARRKAHRRRYSRGYDQFGRRITDQGDVE